MPKKLAIMAALGLLLAGCAGASEDLESPAEVYDTTYPAQYIRESCASVGGTPDGSPAADQKTETAYNIPGEGAGETLTTAAAEPQPDYFLFTRQEQQVADENGTNLLYERYCEPLFSSADAERSGWINGILDTMDTEYKTNSANLIAYAKEFLEENGTELFYSYSNYQELGIARHDDAVVSILSMSSLYSGGIHPNSIQTACNLDLKQQKILTLEDVIYESGAQALAELVSAEVQAKFEPLGEYALFDDYLQTIEQSMTYGTMTPYWYFNDAGLVIFYNQYELGPYAAGIIRVELAYERLDGILRDEYDVVYESVHPSGDLLALSDWAGCEKIPITIEKDGKRLLVGVVGQVFQVQLSEIYWLEQTPIGQEILFSASSMGEHDVLEITGGFTDDGRSFAIEFFNSQGEQDIYYLHTGGLSADP